MSIAANSDSRSGEFPCRDCLTGEGGRMLRLSQARDRKDSPRIIHGLTFLDTQCAQVVP